MYCNWTNSIITVTVLSMLVQYYICSLYLQQQQFSSFTFWLWLFRLWMVVYFLLSWSFQLLTTYSIVRKGSTPRAPWTKFKGDYQVGHYVYISFVLLMTNTQRKIITDTLNNYVLISLLDVHRKYTENFYYICT